MHSNSMHISALVLAGSMLELNTFVKNEFECIVIQYEMETAMTFQEKSRRYNSLLVIQYRASASFRL